MKLQPFLESHSVQISNPMTDISFNLIIFFLVSAVFVADEGLFLLLPDRETRPLELEPAKVLEVKLYPDGSADVSGFHTEAAELGGRLAAMYRKVAGLVTIIESTRGVTYQTVLDTLETAKTAGGTTFSLIVSEGEPLPVEVDRGIGADL